MKKVRLVLVLFSFITYCSVSAQTPHKDFFVGKWNVVAVGTPGGNSKMIVDLKRVNGKLEGQIIREGKDPVMFSKIEENTTSVKVYFRHLFYKVNLLLTKKDETHCDGSLMSKYKASGLRM